MSTPPSRCELTRREFLGALPLAALAVSCGRTPYNRADFNIPAQSEVALLPAADYGAGVVDAIARGLDLLRPAVRGRRVLLKPNLVEYRIRNDDQHPPLGHRGRNRGL